MLWYGKSSRLNFNKVFRGLSYKSRKKFNQQLLRTRGVTLSTSKNFYFYIPFDWNLVKLSPRLWYQKYDICYLYSQIYYFKLPLNSWQVSTYFSNATNILSVSYPLVSPLYMTYFNLMSEVFALFSKSWFLKIKIKGKGYYIYKTYRNTITHQFGHSHRIYLYLSNLSIKFLSKTSILVYGISRKDILSSSRNILQSKPLNIFTGRGVRFARQVIYKKTGKVSSYR